jgi:flavin reductase (DIM6/NTAB) family NADH-FMN oxidoreductase RutF
MNFPGHIERAIAFLTFCHIDKDDYRKPVHLPVQLAETTLSTYICLVQRIIRALINSLQTVRLANSKDIFIMENTVVSEERKILDAKMLRSCMGLFATGVTVVTYIADGSPTGMTANAFMSVSLDPPLVLVSVRANSRFNKWVRRGVRYGINLLAESQKPLSMHFGGSPSDGLELPFINEQETPLLDGSLAQIVCRTVDVHPAGDHYLYIGEVEYVRFGEHERPLVFYSGKYRQILTHLPLLSAKGSLEGW